MALGAGGWEDGKGGRNGMGGSGVKVKRDGVLVLQGSFFSWVWMTVPSLVKVMCL